jgi:23S rRNA (uracil1939-C5)-methyltransferase
MSRGGGRPGRRGKAAAVPPRTAEIDITSLGQRGDGIGRGAGGDVYVAGTLPGDRAVVRIDGRRGEGLAGTLIELLVEGPGRANPPCRYFGQCGGCSVQHLDAALYDDWKTSLLVEPLRRAGFDGGLVAPLQRIAAGTRRRATFAFTRRREAALGFNMRASHQVIDLADCLLLAPPLLALLAPLKAVMAELVEDEGDVVATLTETGLDVLVQAEARLDLFDRQRLAGFADAGDLARLSWRRPGTGPIEPIVQRRAPVVRFAGPDVVLPPGSFLQPSAEGEAALSALVCRAVGAVTPVADLFAGCGSFTFPLAGKAAVHAVEGDPAAVEALTAAAGRAGLRVTAERRDLAQRPLLGDELKRFAAVVFDPPRVGAAAQAEALAAAGPPVVVAVSCNPATLARDARILTRGGYRLTEATPVDQFPWSAHLEVVARFER